jgi:hypothetical protein
MNRYSLSAATRFYFLFLWIFRTYFSIASLLSFLILSCLVLFCFVLSCLVLSGRIAAFGSLFLMIYTDVVWLSVVICVLVLLICWIGWAYYVDWKGKSELSKISPSQVVDAVPSTVAASYVADSEQSGTMAAGSCSSSGRAASGLVSLAASGVIRSQNSIIRRLLVELSDDDDDCLDGLGSLGNLGSYIDLRFPGTFSEAQSNRYDPTPGDTLSRQEELDSGDLDDVGGLDTDDPYSDPFIISANTSERHSVGPGDDFFYDIDAEIDADLADYFSEFSELSELSELSSFVESTRLI